MNKNLKSIFLLTFFCLFLQVAYGVNQKEKELLIRDLEIIHHVFDINYAPRDWKTYYFGWNLDTAFEKAINEINNDKNLNYRKFQKIVRDFLASPIDYHVSIDFAGTETANLPFVIQPIEDRYFIVAIDSSNSMIKAQNVVIGDEVITFNGKPVKQAVEEQLDAKFLSNENTAYALATMTLTSRDASFGDEVPQGLMEITVISKGDDQQRKCLFEWDYSPEHLPPMDQMPWFSGSLDWIWAKEKKEHITIDMASNAFKRFEHKREFEGILGSRKSGLPPLGEIIWTNDPHEEFYAYIYKNEEGKNVGYLRISTYMFESEETGANLIKTFKEFEANTEVLVIDQINNPGGNLINAYFVLSLLATSPMSLIDHRVMINQSYVLAAHYDYEDIEKSMKSQSNESQLANFHYKMHVDDNLDEVGHLFFENFSFSQFLQYKKYLLDIIEEWKQGHYFTSPISLIIEHVEPFPEVHYSKPIIILVNSLDLSCADLIPSFLQDNRRAVVMGTKTAGAGGAVKKCIFPANRHGILGFRYTGSIGQRKSGIPIENLGVTPDVDYQITIDDIQNNFRGYIAEINRQVAWQLFMKSFMTPKPSSDNSESKPSLPKQEDSELVVEDIPKEEMPVETLPESNSEDALIVEDIPKEDRTHDQETQDLQDTEDHDKDMAQDLQDTEGH